MRAHELNENTNILYHTTSNDIARDILNTGVIKPKDFESFISFSKKPFKGDIRHNEVTLEIADSGIFDKVMPVMYNEAWFNKYPDHASYIAGEGWREQYIIPDECYDNESEYEDADCVERAYRDAELDSFLWKKDEEEIISNVMGEPVTIINARIVDESI